jgi:hypothetical protein
MLKNYVQTGTVTKGEKGAVSAPQVYFIFCGIAAKCFINPPPSYAAKFTDLYGLLQTGE